MVWQVYGPCPLLCETAPLLPGPYPGVRRSRRRQVSTRPKSLPQGGRWHGVSRVGGIVLLRFLWQKPAPQPGTLRWARFLPDEKSGKESLRASPPKNLPGVRGWPCVSSTVGPGTGGVTWMVWQVYGQCPLLCETAPLLPGPYPGVRRSRRRQVSTRPKSLPCVKGGGAALGGDGGIDGTEHPYIGHFPLSGTDNPSVSLR